MRNRHGSVRHPGLDNHGMGSMFADVVAGEPDVRDAAAGLPEVDPPTLEDDFG